MGKADRIGTERRKNKTVQKPMANPNTPAPMNHKMKIKMKIKMIIKILIKMKIKMLLNGTIYIYFFNCCEA